MVSGGACRNPWRDISEGYPSFLQGCRFEVGKGDRIRFWEDRWLNEGIIRELFPRLFRLSRKQLRCIESVAVAGPGPVSWDFDFRRPLNEAEVTEVMGLVDILGNVRLHESRSDCRKWVWESSGCFTCKSYRSFLTQRNGQVEFGPCDMIWKAKSPPKVKILVWLVALRKVNTGDTLQLKRPYMSLSPSWCTLCKCDCESADHLFLHCPYSMRLWWRLLGEFQVSWVTPKGCFELLCTKWVVNGRRKRANILWGCMVHALFWNIWAERNRRIFSGAAGLRADELWDRVKFGAALWASVNAVFRDYHVASIANNVGAVLV